MPTLTFSHGRHPFLTFQAEEIETEREGAGLLITASGAITQQDSPALEERIALPTPCHVCIQDGAKALIDQPFTVTFFAVEADQLVAMLG